MTFDPTTARPVEEFDAASAKPVEPGILATALSAIVRGLPMGPAGPIVQLGAESMRRGSELLDRAAYDAGGFVTDKAAKVMSPEAAAGLGVATNVAMQAVPTVLSGPAAARGAAPAITATGERLMQSALKPSLEALKSGKAAQAIETMLEEGINVSKGGVAKLRGKIDDLNAEITQAIANSAETVHKGRVARALIDTLQKFRNQVNPSADIKAIKASWDDFVNHPYLQKISEIPVEIAQQLKQGTYRSLGSKAYGEVKGAEMEAQKALARGLKEGIAEKVPEVVGLNAKESQLLGALNLVERRALMELNKNQAGLATLAENPTAALAFMADRSALFKSIAARMIYSGSEQIPSTVARVLTGAAAAENNAAK